MGDGAGKEHLYNKTPINAVSAAQTPFTMWFDNTKGPYNNDLELNLNEPNKLGEVS